MDKEMLTHTWNINEASNMINISSHKSHYLVDNIFTLDNRDIWSTRICTKRTNTNKYVETYAQDDKNTYLLFIIY